MTRGMIARWTLAAGLLGAIAWALLNHGHLDPAALEDGLRATGGWAPLVFLLLYAAGTVLFLPGSLFALVGGVLFGPVWGSVLNLGAATLGATLAFLVARYVAADWVAQRSGGRLKRIVEGVEAEGWRFVALVRLVPLFPFNLLNYALGLTRIRLDHYVLASLVCMAPGAVAFTWLGHAGREIATGSETAVRSGLLALALLAATALLPRLLRRVRGTAAASGDPVWIEAADLQGMDPGGATVVDVRSPAEFTGALGHIPGSINLPLDTLQERLGELSSDKERRLVMVCKTDKRSAKAATWLRRAGCGHVAVLRGGMEEWNRLGFPTARENAR
ncbi:MAG TPA: VTT domain-containing protein [Azospirillum sp.]|nr:VTT domain-containing protein [Azospirillum sp.]